MTDMTDDLRREELIDIQSAARDSALEEAATVAFSVCAETRHVTLGDKVAETIRAMKGAKFDIEPQVKVKPLVWAEDDGLYTAKSAFVTFFIGEGVAGWEVIWTDYPIHDGLSDVFDTPELAKDAAQALHEAAILSAIEVTS